MGSSHVSDIDLVVGRRLSTVRQIRGLSVEELAIKLNLSTAALIEAEAGMRRTGPLMMIPVCQLLNVPLGYFFNVCDIHESGAIVPSSHNRAKSSSK
jgi:transcriptional regulator with XRE-family HTH domain